MPHLMRRLLLVLAGAALLLPPAMAAAEDRIGARETTMGDPHAPITVIEYGSVTCPHCARFNADILPVLKKRYIDTGKVLYVFREVPINEQYDAAGFLIARCAGPDRYFTVTDALFRAQDELFKRNNLHDFLMAGARAGGLNEEQMKACISDPKAIEAFMARSEHVAEVDKVNSTPTVIVNGTRVDSGNRELAFADIDAVIRPLLGARSGAAAKPVRRRPAAH